MMVYSQNLTTALFPGQKPNRDFARRVRNGTIRLLKTI